jgi:cell division protein FtsW
VKKKLGVDRPLLVLLAILIVGGAFLFASAAFGLLARGSSNMSSVFFSHLVLGLGLGLVAMTVATFLDYRIWKRYAPYVYACAVLATFAVFIPHIGFSHGGARRWLDIAGFSFQPSELMKIGAVMLAALYFSQIKGKIESFTWGFGGLAGILALPAIVLILQPDIGTFGVICISVGAIFFAAGAPWRQIIAVFLAGVIVLTILISVKPYMRDRVMTFLNPAQGQLAESYQIRQSLIAIGSGGFSGRGFGQGVQKFTYLPEPMGDSIFAVAGEELGFIGAFGIVVLFTLFAIRGYSIASRAPDLFGSLLAVGIATYLAVEAFINIASMLGVAPLTGIPLTFISQGGSAILVSLGSAGLLLSISRRRS